MEIPPELFDRNHRIWSDPKRFAAWCRRYGLSVPADADNNRMRFLDARDAWACSLGIVEQDSVDRPDLNLMRALDVPFQILQPAAVAHHRDDLMVTILPVVVHDDIAGTTEPGRPPLADQRAYGSWCDQCGIDPVGTDSWAIRFELSLRAWAVATGITTPTGYVDCPRLAALGVPHCGALQRAKARAGTDVTVDRWVVGNIDNENYVVINRTGGEALRVVIRAVGPFVVAGNSNWAARIKVLGHLDRVEMTAVLRRGAERPGLRITWSNAQQPDQVQTETLYLR